MKQTSFLYQQHYNVNSQQSITFNVDKENIHLHSILCGSRIDNAKTTKIKRLMGTNIHALSRKYNKP